MSKAKPVKAEAEAAPEAAAKPSLKSNEELLKVGDELKLDKKGLEEEKWLVKEVRGVDVLLSRKDYR